MSDCGCEFEATNDTQKKVLYWLLAINATMFFLEFGVGWIAQSTALVADSLDMLADAIVYGIGLYAVGRAAKDKANAALASGYFQLAICILMAVDIGRRILFGSEPVSVLMMGMGSVALIANLTCLALIHKHRDGEVHMRASWIFSANDAIANLGVIVSGALVWWFNVRWPDVVIGCVIVVVVLRGAISILREAKAELREIEKPLCCGSECH